MKKLLVILIILTSWISAIGQDVLKKPNPPRLVNDAAGVLSAEQIQILEQKLVALDDSTSNQIAVVLIKSLGDQGIEEYAVKLFREWGIGNKGTNNGVLILAAIDDRKIRIEVGYGLEGAIPDITTASIIRNEIGPPFREQNYYRGIDNAIDALSKAAVGEYKVKKARKVKGNEEGGRGIFGFIALIIFVIIISIIKGRGGRGGPRGGMMSRNGIGDIATGMILSSLLGGGRGGGWGGGGSSGGFGGGGFGGFGGGSSGGGGASGSW